MATQNNHNWKTTRETNMLKSLYLKNPTPYCRNVTQGHDVSLPFNTMIFEIPTDV